MAQDPAFLFYPNDWLGGTMGMTFEEKGAYMELLILQFNRGHMTKQVIGQTIGQLWDNIKDKFEVDDNSMYFNARLELEQNKRKNFTESRRNNRKGINQYTKKPKKESGHMSKHMESENRNDNKDNKKGVHLFKNSKFYRFTEFEKELTKECESGIDLSFYHGAVMDWSAQGKKKKDWIATARSFMRKDKQEGKLMFKGGKPGKIDIFNDDEILKERFKDSPLFKDQS